MREKKAQRVRGTVVEITTSDTCDMGGRPLQYNKYHVVLETGKELNLYDDVTNSGVLSLCLRQGQTVVVNGYGKLVNRYVKCGLIRERYEQLMEHFGEYSAVKSMVEEYGIDAVNNGYTIAECDGTGMLEIQRIDAIPVFETDEAAVEQAIKDGVKIIPVEELPENFEKRRLGWIDTPENRQKIFGSGSNVKQLHGFD